MKKTIQFFLLHLFLRLGGSNANLLCIIGVCLLFFMYGFELKAKSKNELTFFAFYQFSDNLAGKLSDAMTTAFSGL